MNSPILIPEMHPEWPLYFAQAAVRAHLERLLYQIYLDLSNNVEYRRVVR